MLALAKWIMQGRGQALGFVLIALVTSPVIWLNSILAAAAISLVWLRIGVRDGVMLWAWALLPTVAIAVYLDSFMPMLLVSSSAIISWVLKKTVSWSYTLICISIVGVLTAISLEHFAANSLIAYTEVFNSFLSEFKQQLGQPELQAILPESIETVFVAGLFGTMLVVGTFVSIVIARYWQAKLYNPGGFQKEFHQLRMGKVEVIIILLLTVLFFELGRQYLTWAWFALFPLLIAGIALFHAMAMHKKLATHWYVMFYVVLMFWDPLKIFLAGIAIADSFINFRNKLPKTTPD